MDVIYFFMPGGGVGVTPDGTIPDGAVVCTTEQYMNSSEYTIDQSSTPPSIVAATPQQPSLAAQAAAILAGGLTVTSTATSTLDGTYSVDQLSQMDIIAIETSLNAGKGFPGGGTVFSYLDASGSAHSFTETDFTNFAAVVRDFVYGCKAAIAGTTQVLPAASATIP